MQTLATANAASPDLATDAIFLLERSRPRFAMTSTWAGPTPGRILESLHATAALEVGWDSYDGERIEQGTRSHAQYFICSLFQLAQTLGVRVSEPAVAPGSDGSVAFVWASEQADRDVEILIHQGRIEALESSGDSVTEISADSDEVPWALDLLHRSSFVQR